MRPELTPAGNDTWKWEKHRQGTGPGGDLDTITFAEDTVFTVEFAGGE